jgi:hypothetical protein
MSTKLEEALAAARKAGEGQMSYNNGVKITPVSSLSTTNGSKILNENVNTFKDLTGIDLNNQTYKLPSGQIISGSDPNIEAFKNQGAVLVNQNANQNNQPNQNANQNNQENNNKINNSNSYSFDEAFELWGNDFTGLTKQTDGTFVPDKTAIERLGIKGMTDTTEEDADKKKLQDALTTASSNVENLYNDFQNSISNIEGNPEYQSQVNGIKSLYAKMRQDMERTNQSRMAAYEALGYSTGATRYTGSTQLGVMGEELNQANERIAEINRQEASAISAARTAFKNDKYQEFSIQLDTLKDFRDQKQKELDNYNKTLADVANAQMEQNKFDLEVLKYQQSAMTTDTKEYEYAQARGFSGSYLDYLTVKEEMKQKTDYTTDYKNWILAGGENTGQTFNEWLKQSINKNDELLTPTEAEKLNVPYGTTRQQAFGLKISDGELSSKQLASAIQLSNSLKSHPMYTDMLDIFTGMQGVETGLTQGNGFGDITAINAFQRMVDPGATVRSEDVTLLQSASAWLAKVAPEYIIKKLKEGDKLPESVRQQMLETAKQLYNIRAKNYNNSVGQQYKTLASGAGVPFEMVGQDFILGQQTLQDYYNTITDEQQRNDFKQMIFDEKKKNPNLTEQQLLDILQGNNNQDEDFGWIPTP